MSETTGWRAGRFGSSAGEREKRLEKTIIISPRTSQLSVGRKREIRIKRDDDCHGEKEKENERGHLYVLTISRSCHQQWGGRPRPGVHTTQQKRTHVEFSLHRVCTCPIGCCSASLNVTTTPPPPDGWTRAGHAQLVCVVHNSHITLNAWELIYL